MIFGDLIPIWFQVLFIIAFIIPIKLINGLLKEGLDARNQKIANVFLTIFFIIITFLALNDFYLEQTLPPKIIRTTALPLLIFYLLIFFFSKAYKGAIERIPLEKLIGIHIFRVVGFTFFLLYLFDELPLILGLVAGFGDLTIALSSIFVKKAKSKLVIIIWNTLGMLDIIATSSLAIYFTKVSMETGENGVEILGTFPFAFIPAFAPASILFLHLSIFRKLKENKL